MQTDPTPAEARACPFDGSEPEMGQSYIPREHATRIICNSCGVHVIRTDPWSKDGARNRAIAAWNTRTPSTDARSRGQAEERELVTALEETVSVLERLPYGDWPGKMYSGKVAAANGLIRRARNALAAIRSREATDNSGGRAQTLKSATADAAVVQHLPLESDALGRIQPERAPARERRDVL